MKKNALKAKAFLAVSRALIRLLPISLAMASTLSFANEPCDPSQGQDQAQQQCVSLSPWLQLPEKVRADLSAPLGCDQCLDENQSQLYSAWRESELTVGRGGEKAEFFFVQVLSHEQRNQLLAIYSKMASEQIWEIVKAVKWVSDKGGVLLFKSAFDDDLLRKYLELHGYGDWWMASKDSRWGLRSSAKGAQLHFRGGETTNVHVDLNNPGKPSGEALTDLKVSDLSGALNHLQLDLVDRDATHTIDAIREALRKQGLEVPEVH